MKSGAEHKLLPSPNSPVQNFDGFFGGMANSVNRVAPLPIFEIYAGIALKRPPNQPLPQGFFAVNTWLPAS